MIAAVRGALEHKTLDSALITVGGVTLRVYCPLSTLSRLEVGEMVRVLLRLKDAPKPDDAADAAAIAICHLNTLRVAL